MNAAAAYLIKYQRDQYTERKDREAACYLALVREAACAVEEEFLLHPLYDLVFFTWDGKKSAKDFKTCACTQVSSSCKRVTVRLCSLSNIEARLGRLLLGRKELFWGFESNQAPGHMRY